MLSDLVVLHTCVLAAIVFTMVHGGSTFTAWGDEDVYVRTYIRMYNYAVPLLISLSILSLRLSKKAYPLGTCASSTKPSTRRSTIGSTLTLTTLDRPQRLSKQSMLL